MGGNIDAVSAKSYVQSGLVAQFDGIENAGYGIHDNNAANWVNLVNNNYNGIGNNVGTWGDKCWLNSSDAYAPFSIGSIISDVLDTKIFTVELVFFTTSRTTRQTLFGNFWNTGTVGGISFELNAGNASNGEARYYDSNNSVNIIVKSIVGSNNKMYSFAWSVNKDEATRIRLYVDGVQKSTSTLNMTPWSTGGRDSYIGGERDRNNMSIKGGIYAIRVYNRNLTADEVALNANLDSQRFGV